MRFKHFITSTFFIVLIPAMLVAKTTSQWIEQLEKVYKGYSAVQVSFAVGSDKFSLTLGPESGSYKITTPTEQFISNGTTVWHLFPKDKKVIVDNVRKTAISAASLLDFSANYDVSVENADVSGQYDLTLTPKQTIASVFVNAGNVTSLTFRVSETASGIKIHSITANSTEGNRKLINVSIKPLKKAPDFSYIVPKAFTVTDMRD